jgi:hypothetical protein
VLETGADFQLSGLQGLAGDDVHVSAGEERTDFSIDGDSILFLVPVVGHIGKGDGYLITGVNENVDRSRAPSK